MNLCPYCNSNWTSLVKVKCVSDMFIDSEYACMDCLRHFNVKELTYGAKELRIGE